MDLREHAQQIEESIKELQQELEAKRHEALELQKQANISPDDKQFELFLRKPYLLRLLHKDKYELIIPKFLDFKAGWAVTSNGEYNIFHVSRFIDLITPLPTWLKNELGFDESAFQAHIEDGWLVVDRGNMDTVIKSLGGPKHFSKRSGNRLAIINRYRFDVIRDLIRQGVLPYTPQPLDKSLLRRDGGKIQLRDKQKRDYEIFLNYSAVSVFATGGAGKTFFGMYCMDTVSGKKAILAPRRSILQQWEMRIKAFCPRVLHEVEFRTFQSLKNKPMTGRYSLIIYDEIQHLPAAMGLRAAQADAVSRVGLSATPWREDGQEDLIPALCGIPCGIDWESGKPADTTLWIVDGMEDKFKQLKSILDKPALGKTIIFVYRLEVGKRIAKMFDIPFVHGATKNQYQEIEKADVVVLSKIGDAGISVDARCVIDFDWLGGRAEAGQRALRTQHAQGDSQLHLIMTEHEYQSDVKRLIALHSLNFDIKVADNSNHKKS